MYNFFNKQYYRYFSLLAVLILGVVSILGSGGGGDSTPPPPPAPSVVGVSPSLSSDTALVTTEVLARFSERMDPLTINTNSFLLRDSAAPINGSVDFYAQYGGQDNVAVFVPNNDLDIGEEYFATLTTEITDTSGEPIARDYVWSFFIAPSPVPVSIDETGNFGTTGIDTVSPSAPSATGEYVVFASTDNLANLNTGGISQIYRKNTVTKKVELVSTTSNNQTVAGAPCANPRISDTGRYVVFTSTAQNLDPTVNTMGNSHVYLKDMRDGTIRLLDKSITNIGNAGNGNSSMPDISGIPDTGSGKYVVFESTANDLHVDDTDTTSDIFQVNVTSGVVKLISVSVDQINTPADDASSRPRVSDNGNRVVFESVATNLVANDTNGKSDIFLRNLGNDTTTRLSVTTAGGQVSGGVNGSTNADISADGAYAVYQSDQPNLDGDANGVITDIFLRTINAPSATTILSFAAGDANGANNDSTGPSISADGRYIAFESLATDLLGAGNDTNGQSDIFVRDKNSSTISRVSTDNNNAQVNGTSTTATISANARYVSFTTPYAFDSLDGNGFVDIYRAYNAALP